MLSTNRCANSLKYLYSIAAPYYYSVSKYEYYFGKTGNANETPVSFQHTDLKSDAEGIKSVLVQEKGAKLRTVILSILAVWRK